MKKIVVDYNSLMNFSDNIKKEFNKLCDILMKMKNISIEYQDMIDTNAGNLYKSVMIKELEQEQRNLQEKSDTISKNFAYYSKIYEEKSEIIKKSVGNLNG